MFASDCFKSLNHTADATFNTQIDSAFLAFFECAGYAINTEPTVCTKAQQSEIVRRTSVVPLIEAAMASATPFAAAQNVLEHYTEDVPCTACFAALSAELTEALTIDDRALCRNPYSDICTGAYTVRRAMARFETCAGFALSTDAPRQCTASEWERIQSIEFTKQVWDVVNSSPFSALYKYDAILEMAKQHLGIAWEFTCEKCFSDLVAEFSQLPKNTKDNCAGDKVNSASCYIEGGYEALAKFADCSGFVFLV